MSFARPETKDSVNIYNTAHILKEDLDVKMVHMNQKDTKMSPYMTSQHLLSKQELDMALRYLNLD